MLLKISSLALSTSFRYVPYSILYQGSYFKTDLDRSRSFNVLRRLSVFGQALALVVLQGMSCYFV